MKEERMLYSRYKKFYADCKTVPNTYDKSTKSIVVIIPEGRQKKSGVRRQTYKYMTFDGIIKGSERKVSVTIKAISRENAIKQLLKNYDKNIIWDLS